MSINCLHWTKCGVQNGGCCSLGLFGGTPSNGICNTVCDQKHPISLQDKMWDKAHQNLENDVTLKTTLALKDKLKALLPVLQASTFGKEVSLERQEKRLNICSECEKLSIIDNNIGCGICGCTLKIDDKSIANLISLEETENYGCKHPSGSKWKRDNI